MSFTIRSAWSTDLLRLANLAEECQIEPELRCSYLSADSSAIIAELVKINGTEDWTTVTWVALDDARRLMGWIAAETDLSMGRIWWFGPFITEPMSLLTDSVLDALFATARAALAGFDEHELAFDRRAGVLGRFAERNGFHAEEGSTLLRCVSLDVPFHASGVQIERVDGPRPGVVALHDQLFPGTHATGSQLFGRRDVRHDRFVALEGERAVGYVATELQNDGSLYVDFVGVAPDQRRRGVGRALIATAMRHRLGEATHAHLTVRTSNASARRLYASLGYVEDGVIVPYRRGFTLD